MRTRRYVSVGMSVAGVSGPQWPFAGHIAPQSHSPTAAAVTTAQVMAKSAPRLLLHEASYSLAWGGHTR